MVGRGWGGKACEWRAGVGGEEIATEALVRGACGEREAGVGGEAGIVWDGNTVVAVGR